MFDRINVLIVVGDHVRTFRGYGTGKYVKGDCVVYFGGPLVAAVLVVLKYGILRPDLVSVIATSLSTSAALLFCVLMLAYDAIGKTRVLKDDSDALRRQFLEEVVSNISFAILVAISAVAMIVIVVLIAHDAGAADNGGPQKVAEDYRGSVAIVVLSAAVYWLMGMFFVTLLVVLKRVHVLLRNEAKDGL